LSELENLKVYPYLELKLL